MTDDTNPPWIDLNVWLKCNQDTRYTHAHDFNDGKVSFYGMALTEAQIRNYFATFGMDDIIVSRAISRERTRMLVTMTLYTGTYQEDAQHVREKLNHDLGKYKHTAPRP